MDAAQDGAKAARPGIVSLAQASTIIDRAIAHGRSLSLPPLTVAILDPGGRLVAMKREDESSFLRPEIAHAKAFGALAMGMGSRALAERAATHPAFIASITALAGGNLVPVPGGILLRAPDGILVGGVGISGALPDQDEACAIAGIEAAGLLADIHGGH